MKTVTFSDDEQRLVIETFNNAINAEDEAASGEEFVDAAYEAERQRRSEERIAALRSLIRKVS